MGKRTTQGGSGTVLTTGARADPSHAWPPEQYRAFFEVAPDGIVVVDEEGTILLLNAQAEVLFGYARDEVIGKRLELLVPERSRSHHRTDCAGYFSSPRVRPMGTGIELTGRRKDGTEFPVDISLSYSKAAEGMRALAFVRDATEQRKSEQTNRRLAEEKAARSASEDSRRRIAFLDEVARTLLDTPLTSPGRDRLERVAQLVVSHLGGWCIADLLNENGSIRRAALARAGLVEPGPPGQLSQTFPDRPPPEWMDMVLRTGRPTVVSGPDVDIDSLDLGPYTPHSERAVTSLLCVPLHGQGRTLGALTLLAEDQRVYQRADIALAEDLARRTSLAIEHVRLFERAEQAVRARDELVAIVSHDLKNPLSSIFLACRLLLKESGKELSDESKKRVATVMHAAQRMDRLIFDLLDAANLERGHLSIEHAEVIPTQLVQDTLELLKAMADEKSLRFEVVLPQSPALLYCDRARVQQVLTNLISNAIKFSRNGGSIRLELQVEDGGVWFLVRDSGPGIPSEQLPHLFERYWRGEGQKREGTGLGLFIAKGIVEAHGGRIWVESEVGVGSTFIFTLPTFQDAKHARASAGPRESSTAHP